MQSMTRAAVLAGALVAAGPALAESHGAPEADLAAGEEVYQGECRACHGPKAQGLASYPRLYDKEVAYLAERLQTYRAGERIGPNSMLMIPHAKKLSDADITNVVAYITETFP